MRELGLSRDRLLMVLSKTADYRQVRSKRKDSFTFEMATPNPISGRRDQDPAEVLHPEIRAMRVFTFQDQRLRYALPISTKLPVALSQIVVLYTVMFWLGSLVRYDLASVSRLQDSRYWVLIDGFMNQSRLWLLELFEWEIYRKETDLVRAR
jgi:hypothetical protein